MLILLQVETQAAELGVTGFKYEAQREERNCLDLSSGL